MPLAKLRFRNGIQHKLMSCGWAVGEIDKRGFKLFRISKY